MSKNYIFVSATMAACLIGGTAVAEPAFTTSKTQVGVALGYGIYTGESADDSFNAYGVGFGVRGGYTLSPGVYLGGVFDYYLGDSGNIAEVETSANIYQFEAEVGYDLGLGSKVALRPKIGIGYGILASEVKSSAFTASNTSSAFAFTPGVQVLFDLKPVFLSADIRYNILSSKPEGATESSSASGLLLGAGAGIAF